MLGKVSTRSTESGRRECASPPLFPSILTLDDINVRRLNKNLKVGTEVAWGWYPSGTFNVVDLVVRGAEGIERLPPAAEAVRSPSPMTPFLAL
jgi:hypothetical protein